MKQHKLCLWALIVSMLSVNNLRHSEEYQDVYLLRLSYSLPYSNSHQAFKYGQSRTCIRRIPIDSKAWRASLFTQKRQVVRSNPVLQRIEAVQRTTAATTPVIIGVGRKTPSNHTIQTIENTESLMIHSLHPNIAPEDPFIHNASKHKPVAFE